MGAAAPAVAAHRSTAATDISAALQDELLAKKLALVIAEVRRNKTDTTQLPKDAMMVRRRHGAVAGRALLPPLLRGPSASLCIPHSCQTPPCLLFPRSTRRTWWRRWRRRRCGRGTATCRRWGRVRWRCVVPAGNHAVF